MTPTTWTYPALVRRVVDADSLDLDLDLGMRVHHVGRCRLASIDAPERTTPEGAAATAFVAQVCPPGTVVTFTSKRLDQYGRPTGDVRLPDGRDLGQVLLAAGHATPYDRR